MITNEMAGSGGDAMPWTVPQGGMALWDADVGRISRLPGPGDLIDGGNVGTPNLAFYNLDGAWMSRTMRVA